VSIRSKLGAVRRGIYRSLFRRLVPVIGGPYVSFTFDDFPRSAYTNGAAVLDSFGLRGTFYVAKNLMNQSDRELGEFFRLEDLDGLAAREHEIASHTFGHISSRKTTRARFVENARLGQEALRAAGFRCTRNFAYPFGDPTILTKAALRKHMTSCRVNFRGLNAPNVDLNLLKANSMVGSDEASCVRLIKENLQRKGWLIFYTHDVRQRPSAYGCTPTMFTAVVQAAISSGSNVAPIQSVLSQMGAE
jgi:peptidoglycan/xylan/chitin deacetylase (PgdA/CDA1 family)